MNDDRELRTLISKTVADFLNNPVGSDRELLPPGMPSSDQHAILADVFVFSISAAIPGSAPDGKPGWLPANADLKAAVINEIDAMRKADFDVDEHAIMWDEVKNSLETTPAADFNSGVDVVCPDGYVLSLKCVSCADALKDAGISY